MRTPITKTVTVRRIMLALFMATSLSGFAQVQDTLYVYKAGTLSSKLAVADVDSITFIPPAKSTNKEINNFIYSLAVNDYSFISLAAQAIATNGNEFDAAKAIGTNRLFIDTLYASNFIPLLLVDKYKNTGELSTALITYNFYNPCDTSKIVSTNKYTLITTDYDAMGTSTGLPGQYDYFSPTIDPTFYIPIWLKINNPYAKLNDIKLIRYKYLFTPTITQRATVFQFNGTNWEVYNSTKQTTANFRLKNGKWIVSNIFSEKFLKDFGSFKPVIVIGTYSWTWSSYGIVGNAYMKGPTETWLVSPEIDLKDRVNPTLTFDHAVNYGTGLPVTDLASVYISTNYSTDVTNATWEKLNFIFPTTYSWTFLSSGKIDLSAYINKKITVGFKYVSDTSMCLAWEIKNVNLFDQY